MSSINFSGKKENPGPILQTFLMPKIMKQTEEIVKKLAV